MGTGGIGGSKRELTKVKDLASKQLKNGEARCRNREAAQAALGPQVGL
jgi:hypothetical protein